MTGLKNSSTQRQQQLAAEVKVIISHNDRITSKRLLKRTGMTWTQWSNYYKKANSKIEESESRTRDENALQKQVESMAKSTALSTTTMKLIPDKETDEFSFKRKHSSNESRKRKRSVTFKEQPLPKNARRNLRGLPLKQMYLKLFGNDNETEAMDSENDSETLNIITLKIDKGNHDPISTNALKKNDLHLSYNEKDIDKTYFAKSSTELKNSDSPKCKWKGWECFHTKEKKDQELKPIDKKSECAHSEEKKDLEPKPSVKKSECAHTEKKKDLEPKIFVKRSVKIDEASSGNQIQNLVNKKCSIVVNFNIASKSKTKPMNFKSLKFSNEPSKEKRKEVSNSGEDSDPSVKKDLQSNDTVDKFNDKTCSSSYSEVRKILEPNRSEKSSKNTKGSSDTVSNDYCNQVVKSITKPTNSDFSTVSNQSSFKESQEILNSDEDSCSSVERVTEPKKVKEKFNESTCISSPSEQKYFPSSSVQKVVSSIDVFNPSPNSVTQPCSTVQSFKEPCVSSLQEQKYVQSSSAQETISSDGIIHSSQNLTCNPSQSFKEKKTSRDLSNPVLVPCDSFPIYKAQPSTSNLQTSEEQQSSVSCIHEKSHNDTVVIRKLESVTTSSSDDEIVLAESSDDSEDIIILETIIKTDNNCIMPYTFKTDVSRMSPSVVARNCSLLHSVESFDSCSAQQLRNLNGDAEKIRTENIVSRFKSHDTSLSNGNQNLMNSRFLRDFNNFLSISDEEIIKFHDNVYRDSCMNNLSFKNGFLQLIACFKKHLPHILRLETRKEIKKRWSVLLKKDRLMIRKYLGQILSVACKEKQVYLIIYFTVLHLFYQIFNSTDPNKKKQSILLIRFTFSYILNLEVSNEDEIISEKNKNKILYILNHQYLLEECDRMWTIMHQLNLRKNCEQAACQQQILQPSNQNNSSADPVNFSRIKDVITHTIQQSLSTISTSKTTISANNSFSVPTNNLSSSYSATATTNTTIETTNTTIETTNTTIDFSSLVEENKNSDSTTFHKTTTYTTSVLNQISNSSNIEGSPSCVFPTSPCVSNSDASVASESTLNTTAKIDNVIFDSTETNEVETTSDNEISERSHQSGKYCDQISPSNGLEKLPSILPSVSLDDASGEKIHLQYHNVTLDCGGEVSKTIHSNLTPPLLINGNEECTPTMITQEAGQFPISTSANEKVSSQLDSASVTNQTESLEVSNSAEVCSKSRRSDAVQKLPVKLSNLVSPAGVHNHDLNLASAMSQNTGISGSFPSPVADCQIRSSSSNENVPNDKITQQRHKRAVNKPPVLPRTALNRGSPSIQSETPISLVAPAVPEASTLSYQPTSLPIMRHESSRNLSSVSHFIPDNNNTHHPANPNFNSNGAMTHNSSFKLNDSNIYSRGTAKAYAQKIDARRSNESRARVSRNLNNATSFASEINGQRNSNLSIRYPQLYNQLKDKPNQRINSIPSQIFHNLNPPSSYAQIAPTCSIGTIPFAETVMCSGVTNPHPSTAFLLSQQQQPSNISFVQPSNTWALNHVSPQNEQSVSSFVNQNRSQAEVANSSIPNIHSQPLIFLNSCHLDNSSNLTQRKQPITTNHLQGSNLNSAMINSELPNQSEIFHNPTEHGFNSRLNPMRCESPGFYVRTPPQTSKSHQKITQQYDEGKSSMPNLPVQLLSNPTSVNKALTSLPAIHSFNTSSSMSVNQVLMPKQVESNIVNQTFSVSNRKTSNLSTSCHSSTFDNNNARIENTPRKEINSLPPRSNNFTLNINHDFSFNAGDKLITVKVLPPKDHQTTSISEELYSTNKRNIPPNTSCSSIISSSSPVSNVEKTVGHSDSNSMQNSSAPAPKFPNKKRVKYTERRSSEALGLARVRRLEIACKSINKSSESIFWKEIEKHKVKSAVDVACTSSNPKLDQDSALRSDGDNVANSSLQSNNGSFSKKHEVKSIVDSASTSSNPKLDQDCTLRSDGDNVANSSLQSNNDSFSKKHEVKSAVDSASTSSNPKLDQGCTLRSDRDNVANSSPQSNNASFSKKHEVKSVVDSASTSSNPKLDQDCTLRSDRDNVANSSPQSNNDSFSKKHEVKSAVDSASTSSNPKLDQDCTLRSDVDNVANSSPQSNNGSFSKKHEVKSAVDSASTSSNPKLDQDSALRSDVDNVANSSPQSNNDSFSKKHEVKSAVDSASTSSNPKLDQDSALRSDVDNVANSSPQSNNDSFSNLEIDLDYQEKDTNAVCNSSEQVIPVEKENEDASPSITDSDKHSNATKLDKMEEYILNAVEIIEYEEKMGEGQMGELRILLQKALKEFKDKKGKARDCNTNDEVNEVCGPIPSEKTLNSNAESLVPLSLNTNGNNLSSGKSVKKTAVQRLEITQCMPPPKISDGVNESNEGLLKENYNSDNSESWTENSKAISSNFIKTAKHTLPASIEKPLSAYRKRPFDLISKNSQRSRKGSKSTSSSSLTSNDKQTAQTESISRGQNEYIVLNDPEYPTKIYLSAKTTKASETCNYNDRTKKRKVSSEGSPNSALMYNANHFSRSKVSNAGATPNINESNPQTPKTKVENHAGLKPTKLKRSSSPKKSDKTCKRESHKRKQRAREKEKKKNEETFWKELNNQIQGSQTSSCSSQLTPPPTPEESSLKVLCSKKSCQNELREKRFPCDGCSSGIVYCSLGCKDEDFLQGHCNECERDAL